MSQPVSTENPPIASLFKLATARQRIEHWDLSRDRPNQVPYYPYQKGHQRFFIFGSRFFGCVTLFVFAVVVFLARFWRVDCFLRAGFF
ncbi:MAG TPA: hypothetical protein VF458_20360 [Ktedonobacteraceae bacterium]